MIDDEDIDALAARVKVRGRGTGEMMKGRFEKVEVAFAGGDAQQVQTEVFKDSSRSIVAFNDSPDVGFSASVNPYRGCEHGCIYCYARPNHEYLGFSPGLDFETKLFAKMEAPALLRKALSAKNWVPQTIGMSGVTDCYQPIEKELKITQGCLQVLAEFRNPVVVITKHHLVTRDVALLAELAQFQAAHVVLSITTLDRNLARTMEPRASTPPMRLQAVETLAKAGVPVTVNMAPIIPGLTDHEIPAILKAAAEAGAIGANFVMVRLPYAVKDLFENWLQEYYPLKKDKVLNRIREVRGGKLYDSDFASRMAGEGVYAEHVKNLFNQSLARYGLNRGRQSLSTQHFRKAPEAQMNLF